MKNKTWTRKRGSRKEPTTNSSRLLWGKILHKQVSVRILKVAEYLKRDLKAIHQTVKTFSDSPSACVGGCIKIHEKKKRKKKQKQNFTFLHCNERLHQFLSFMQSVKIILMRKQQLAMWSRNISSSHGVKHCNITDGVSCLPHSELFLLMLPLLLRLPV